MFGGARMISTDFDVGRKNVEFIMEFVENEHLNVISSSLGGTRGRRVEFHPSTGKSRQKLLAQASDPVPIAPQKVLEPASGDIELF